MPSRNKIRKIWEYAGVTLTHAEITFLCVHVLESKDEADFYKKMNDYISIHGIEEFKNLVRKLRKKSIGFEFVEGYQSLYN